MFSSCSQSHHVPEPKAQGDGEQSMRCPARRWKTSLQSNMENSAWWVSMLYIPNSSQPQVDLKSYLVPLLPASPWREDVLPEGQHLGKALYLQIQSSPSSTHSGRFCSWKMQLRTTLGSSSAWLQAWGSTRAQEQGRAWRARSAPRHAFSTSASRWPGCPSKLLGNKQQVSPSHRQMELQNTNVARNKNLLMCTQSDFLPFFLPTTTKANIHASIAANPSPSEQR